MLNGGSKTLTVFQTSSTSLIFVFFAMALSTMNPLNGKKMNTYAVN